jgi:Family of unknown function (DUF6444)
VERAEAEAILDGDRETAVALLVGVGALVEANRRLEVRVGELEQRLSRSSRNSSLPPSQDPPSTPPRPRAPASGRRPGGQPGHEGRSRRLLPLEQLDELVEHWPARCGRCARPFAVSERIEAASPQRHQVWRAAGDRGHRERASSASPALPRVCCRDSRRMLTGLFLRAR